MPRAFRARGDVKRALRVRAREAAVVDVVRRVRRVQRAEDAVSHLHLCVGGVDGVGVASRDRRGVGGGGVRARRGFDRSQRAEEQRGFFLSSAALFSDRLGEAVQHRRGRGGVDDLFVGVGVFFFFFFVRRARRGRPTARGGGGGGGGGFILFPPPRRLFLLARGGFRFLLLLERRLPPRDVQQLPQEHLRLDVLPLSHRARRVARQHRRVRRDRSLTRLVILVSKRRRRRNVFLAIFLVFVSVLLPAFAGARDRVRPRRARRREHRVSQRVALILRLLHAEVRHRQRGGDLPSVRRRRREEVRRDVERRIRGQVDQAVGPAYDRS
eukprot:29403-Pelagococcus_subviridis.AAC.8